MQRQVPAPRVPDDPRAPARDGIDHGLGVGEVRLDGERLVDGGRQEPPLLVEDRREDARQKRHQRVEVARRHARAAVEQDRRRAIAVEPPAVDLALGGGDDERLHLGAAAGEVEEPSEDPPARGPQAVVQVLVGDPGRSLDRRRRSRAKVRLDVRVVEVDAAAAGTSFRRSTSGSYSLGQSQLGQ